MYNINLPTASKPPPLQVKSDSRLHTFAWDGLGTGYFTPLRYIFTKIPIHSSNLPLGPHPINRNSSDSTHLYTGTRENGERFIDLYDAKTKRTDTCLLLKTEPFFDHRAIRRRGTCCWLVEIDGMFYVLKDEYKEERLMAVSRGCRWT